MSYNDKRRQYKCTFIVKDSRVYTLVARTVDPGDHANIYTKLAVLDG
jgi:hypothetical protein